MIVQTVALLSVTPRSLVNAGPHQPLETGMVEASLLDSSKKIWGATCVKQSYLGGRWSLGFIAGVNHLPVQIPRVLKIVCPSAPSDG